MVNHDSKQTNGVSAQEVKSILLDDEVIVAMIAQYIPGITKSIILTNDRLIIYSKDPVRSHFKDYFFRDIRDVQFANSLAKGGKITINSDRGNNQGKAEVNFLPGKEARDFYVKVQHIEKVWFSKKRDMELEDKRASSGAATVTLSSASNNESDDIEAKLTKLQSLKTKGLINEETYKIKYNELIDQI